MLVQTVKITLSPFNPNVEVVGPMVFDIRAPYSDKEVTLVVNSNIQHYEDKADTPKEFEVRQVMVSQDTDETQILSLNLDSNSEQIINFQKVKYKVKLLNIGKENIQGQDFKNFEFLVEEQ